MNIFKTPTSDYGNKNLIDKNYIKRRNSKIQFSNTKKVNNEFQARKLNKMDKKSRNTTNKFFTPKKRLSILKTQKSEILNKDRRRNAEISFKNVKKIYNSTENLEPNMKKGFKNTKHAYNRLMKNSKSIKIPKLKTVKVKNVEHKIKMHKNIRIDDKILNKKPKYFSKDIRKIKSNIKINKPKIKTIKLTTKTTKTYNYES